MKKILILAVAAITGCVGFFAQPDCSRAEIDKFPRDPKHTLDESKG